MGLFETFETDTKAEAEGKWFNFPPNKDGSKPGFKLARMSRSNPRYLAALESVMKTFKTEIKLEILSEEMAYEPFLEIFLDTILIDWRNVQDKNGVTIPYSRDNAKELFEKLPSLYEILREQANSLVNFRSTEVEATAPN
jgi:hypothetical protein